MSLWTCFEELDMHASNWIEFPQNLQLSIKLKNSGNSGNGTGGAIRPRSLSICQQSFFGSFVHYLPMKCFEKQTVSLTKSWLCGDCDLMHDSTVVSNQTGVFSWKTAPEEHSKTIWETLTETRLDPSEVKRMAVVGMVSQSSDSSQRHCAMRIPRWTNSTSKQ